MHSEVISKKDSSIILTSDTNKSYKQVYVDSSCNQSLFLFAILAIFNRNKQTSKKIIGIKLLSQSKKVYPVKINDYVSR